MKTEKAVFVAEYDRAKRDIPHDVREKILDEMRFSLGLTAEKIASLLNVKAQTVRCWFSKENPRMISSVMLVELCEFYGKNAYKDFP